MSNFWNLNDGGNAIQGAQGSYEIEGGDLEPIPAKTGCIAAIEEAKWDEYDGDRYISLKWRVAQPQQYANRVIFHKVKVFGTSRDKDPQATADRAKRMLAAIDANAGGRLSKIQSEPTDQDLMSALMGKMMAIKVMVWEMEINGEQRKGNWVSAVSPVKGGQASAPAAAAPQPPAQPAAANWDDDIPFN